MKRRSSAIVTQPCVSPSVKRTKVQAQRKFAQNNYAFSGTKILAKTSEEYKAAAATMQMSSPENEECELNTFSSLPTVDDLLTFLCFRQTDVLPVRLDYLNTPQFDVFPEPKKSTKAPADDSLSSSRSLNDLDDEENIKCRTSRNSMDKKKFRSRNLTSKSNCKAARFLALKHNQRLRSKNVVKAKITESKLKCKLVSPPKNLAQSNKNVFNGPSTRNSARRLMDTTQTKSIVNPSRRVTRQNFAVPKSPDIVEEVPKKVKSISSSSRINPPITSELSIRLENSFPLSKSLLLPKPVSNFVNAVEITAVVEKEKAAAPVKPVTRRTRNEKCPQEETRSTRSRRTRLVKTPKKVHVHNTRSGSALLGEETRNSTVEDKSEKETVPINVRPSRRTKEAAAFYMELLGKELRCPNYDDDEDDSLSFEGFSPIRSDSKTARRARETEKEVSRISKSAKTSKPISRRASVNLPSQTVIESDKNGEKPSLTCKTQASKGLGKEAQKHKISKVEEAASSTSKTEKDTSKTKKLITDEKKKDSPLPEKPIEIEIPLNKISKVKPEKEGRTSKRSITEEKGKEISIPKTSAAEETEEEVLAPKILKTKETEKSVSTSRRSSVIETGKEVPKPKTSKVKEVEKEARTIKTSKNEAPPSTLIGKESPKVKEVEKEVRTNKTPKNDAPTSTSIGKESSKVEEMEKEVRTIKTSKNEAPISTSIGKESSKAKEVDKEVRTIKTSKNEAPISTSIGKDSSKAKEVDKEVRTIKTSKNEAPISTSIGKDSSKAKEMDKEVRTIKTSKNEAPISTSIGKESSKAKEMEKEVRTIKISKNEAPTSTSIGKESSKVKEMEKEVRTIKTSKNEAPTSTSIAKESEKDVSVSKTSKAKETLISKKSTVREVEKEVLPPAKLIVKRTDKDTRVSKTTTNEETRKENLPDKNASLPEKSVSTKTDQEVLMSKKSTAKETEKEAPLPKKSTATDKVKEASTCKRWTAKETEKGASVPEKSVVKTTEEVDSIRTRKKKRATSPTTIEVTIKDLSKRQKPEKSVFKKKLVPIETNDDKASKNKTCDLPKIPNDLIKTNAVEIMNVTAKSDDELCSADATRKKVTENVTEVISPSRDSVTESEDTTLTPVDVGKNPSSTEKKIFRKSDGELKRKTEAFSADNENSVYAFEPDLPTTSPPFRRLKSVTPTKVSSVGNSSVAVQVNFGKDVKVECSSTGDTQVSSTTDSGGDRVFYIPIQTSASTSTLGVAVKLGTDGPNQKIFMSATLITNSPAFTTNTVTNVASKSSTMETICVQTDTITSSSKAEPTRRRSCSAITLNDNIEEEKNLKSRRIQKSSNTNLQSVKILKLNKTKKIDQSANADSMKLKSESTSGIRNENSRNLESSKTKSQATSSNKNENSCSEIVKSKADVMLSSKNQIETSTSTVKKDIAKGKVEPTLTSNKNIEKSKPESTLWSKNKKVETSSHTAKESSELKSRVNKNKKTNAVGSSLGDKDKLPVIETPTKKLNPTMISEKVDLQTATKTHEDDDIICISDSSSSSSSSSSPILTLPKSSAQRKPSTSSTSGSKSVKSFKVNTEKKVESPGPSSRAHSPIHGRDPEMVTREDDSRSQAKKAKLMKSKPKAKGRPQKSGSVGKQTADSENSSTKKSGKILEAPTFRPSKEQFNDPLEYIESIRPVAEKFGLCRIIPPSDFRPECKVADEMRFTAYNQYIHKMLDRWGPNVKELLAIKKFLATQNIQLTQAPWIGGMEVDLPRLYQTVQQCGGLSAVIQKERWQVVADNMRIPKLAQDRTTKLDDIYCKYLLPYDILSPEEREKILADIDKEWAAHLKKSSDDELFEDVDECVLKGRTMPLSCFYRIARNTMMMCFGGQSGPSTETIEREFWNHVSTRKSHICVHSGSIDSGTHGYGFSVAKNSAFRKHPWNLKVLTNNSASILRFLGPIMGVTVPTLHVGMLYSAFCWYRDPHGLPWIEYLHTGADKIWYGIPDEHSENFRKAMLKLAPRYCRDKKIWLSSDTVMIPPPLLNAQGVSLSRVVQRPGQFIVVFPKAFTSSISTGYLVSESVYFAQASWLDSARQIFTDMKESCEPAVFSLEQLIISIADDARPHTTILTKILPLLNEIRETEATLRVLLKERGVNSFEKLNTNKKRKSKSSFQEEEYYECDVCHTNLFVSLVVNSNKQSNYCLQHAVALLQRKSTQAKHCKLLYAYTEEELTELVDKVKSRIEAKSAKKL